MARYKFEERGNGFPGVGDHVHVDNGCNGGPRIALVTKTYGIHTQQWRSNTMLLEADEDCFLNDEHLDDYDEIPWITEEGLED